LNISNDRINEQLVIGLSISFDEARQKILSQLTDDHFSQPDFRTCFIAISNLVEKNLDVNAYTVKSELSLIGDVLSLDEIISIEDKYFIPEKLDSLIELLIDRHDRRKTIDECQSLIKKLKNDPDPYQQLIKDFKLENSSSILDEKYITGDTYTDFRIKTLEDRKSKTSIYCGIKEIDDNLTYKFEEGEISIVAGRPSNGKCLKGNSLINTNHGLIELRNIKVGDLIWTKNNDDKLELDRVIDKIDSGKKQLYKIVLSKIGYQIEASNNHLFLTKTGWKSLKDLSINEDLIALIESDFIFLPIKSIDLTDIDDTYDLTLLKNSNFIANNILVHNSLVKGNLITNMCNLGTGVASYALEQTMEVESDRIDSIISGIPIKEIVGSHSWLKSDNRLEKLKNAWEIQSKWNYHLLEGTNKSENQMRNELRMLAKKGVKVVFFDLFDRLKGVGDSPEFKAQKVSATLVRYLTMAKEFKQHYCLLVQINRNSEKKKDPRPSLWELKDSGAYEEFARIVMLLHYPNFYDTTLLNYAIEVNIAKQSNGPQVNVALNINPQCLKIINTQMRQVEFKKVKKDEKPNN
jgi:replicative DNA helicase